MGDYLKGKGKYLSSAALLLLTSVIVKVISAFYKIPLTAFIGAVGRGYFAAAYNVYLPLHAVLMGALPVAMSRLVSKYNALGDKKMLSSLKRGALSVFTLAGIFGMAVILLAAKPYSALVAASPKSVYTIYVIAPSIFFSCLCACYRGYFEGFMNMVPTSVSQTLEALFKMVFGLLFAKLSMAYMLKSYSLYGTVLGVSLSSETRALSFIYPFTSAAAMSGAALGSFISYIYIIFYYRLNRDKSLPRVCAKRGRAELLRFSFPIMFSCSVQSVFQFLDTATVQFSLSKLPVETLIKAFPHTANIEKTDAVTYVFGLFSAALDFKNLVPGVTMALGICAVPAICAEFESKNTEKLFLLINSVYKYTSVLSCFGAGLIALASKDILEFFYSSSPDIVSGCNMLVFYFGLTVPVYSLASTAVFSVQALGKPERSVFPYILSGIIRTVLNIVLIRYTKLVLFGAVVSGAVGYLILFLMNSAVVKSVSKVKFEVKNIIMKPIFVTFLSVFFSQKLIFLITFSNSLFFNLLIKTALFGAIYCILCFFVKLINFKQIFCVLKLKKMA